MAVLEPGFRSSFIYSGLPVSFPGVVCSMWDPEIPHQFFSSGVCLASLASFAGFGKFGQLANGQFGTELERSR